MLAWASREGRQVSYLCQPAGLDNRSAPSSPALPYMLPACCCPTLDPCPALPCQLITNQATRAAQRRQGANEMNSTASARAAQRDARAGRGGVGRGAGLGPGSICPLSLSPTKKNPAENFSLALLFPSPGSIILLLKLPCLTTSRKAPVGCGRNRRENLIEDRSGTVGRPPASEHAEIKPLLPLSGLT